MKKLLTQYEQAHKALKNLKDANADLFGVLDTLNQTILDLENEIKNEAKKLGEDVEQGNITVKVIARWKKWYDWKQFNESERSLISSHDGVEVIREVVDQLAKDEVITEESRARAFKEQQMPSAVSIRIKE
jgi:geranylgeranyl pyrophosphate synthase